MKRVLPLDRKPLKELKDVSSAICLLVLQTQYDSIVKLKSKRTKLETLRLMTELNA